MQRRSHICNEALDSRFAPDGTDQEVGRFTRYAEKRDQSSPKRKPSALAPTNNRPHRSFVESGVTKLVARSYELARSSTRVKHAKSLSAVAKVGRRPRSHRG